MRSENEREREWKREENKRRIFDNGLERSHFD